MAGYEFAHSHGVLDSYYASPAWAQRKAAYFARFHRRCEACGSTDRIDLHHADYTNVGDERDADLVALCRGCHAECHHLQAEFGWNVEDTTRRFLAYRKQQAERAELRAGNDELRRKQDALAGRAPSAPEVQPLVLSVQEPLVVKRREPRPRWAPPQPRGNPGVCIECGEGEPGPSACGVCLTPVHLRCSRLKREPICSVECSIEWMEAFGHA